VFAQGGLVCLCVEENNVRAILVSLALAVSGLIFAYFIDGWQQAARQEAAQTLVYWPIAIVAGVVPVAITVMLAIFAWLFLARVQPNFWSASILLAIGLMATFSIAIWLLVSQRDLPFSVAPILEANSRISQVGAGLATIGAVGLWKSIAGRQ
jgi:uncharacterized membrane protein